MANGVGAVVGPWQGALAGGGRPWWLPQKLWQQHPGQGLGPELERARLRTRRGSPSPSCVNDKEDKEVRSPEIEIPFFLPVKQSEITDSFLGASLKDEVSKTLPVQKQTRADQVQGVGCHQRLCRPGCSVLQGGSRCHPWDRHRGQAFHQPCVARLLGEQDRPAPQCLMQGDWLL
ncbi:unnamed protein product [Gulo gulo]|uniref:Uncharacterized protein n=1 Tax=Gulo gulo TaxID=48420 RepID=A0A9X9LI09_GULGU|nr:unnamed protein product [Gulo gulo]